MVLSSTASSLFRERVENYYRFADAQDFDSLCALFDDKVLYQRCERLIRGVEELRKFYKDERKLTGRHTLESLFEDGDKIIVKGTYEGKKHSGEPVHLSFIDYFISDQKGKIIQRQTYLAQGYQLTK